ncbi:hypothetical protein HYS84_02805 [Candidatus Saccharibacteria bacterium]|nr:hypothetical protein [Candidatus Saccharibacteria bacterium]
MARKDEQRLLNKRWVRVTMALIFLGIAYGFASLAIDSGSLLEYALAIIFLVWGIKSTFRVLKRGPTLEKGR